MNRPLRLLSLAAGFAACGSAASAQELIAQFPLDNTAGSYANAVLTDYVTVSDLNPAAGGSLSGTALAYFKNNSGNTIPESLDAALAANHYLGFTVTPNGFAIDLDTLRFAFGLSNNTTSVDPYVGNWAFYTSATGFTLGDVIATGSFQLPRSSGFTPFYQNPAPSVFLGEIGALQQVTAPVELRIYFWDNSATSTSNLIMRFDTIELTATAIPEPGVLASLALGLAGLVALRRRTGR